MLSPMAMAEDESARMTVFGARSDAMAVGGKPRHLGLMLTAALLVTTFAHGDRRGWLTVGVMSMAVLVAGVGLARSTEVVFVLAFLLGAAQIILAQNALVSVHSATPDALRGSATRSHRSSECGWSPPSPETACCSTSTARVPR